MTTTSLVNIHCHTVTILFLLKMTLKIYLATDKFTVHCG